MRILKPVFCDLFQFSCMLRLFSYVWKCMFYCALLMILTASDSLARPGDLPLADPVSVSLVPRPTPSHREGPGTHWVHMLYFPSKYWEFVFYHKICSILLRVEIVNYPFHKSSLAFVRICCAYRPPSSLKVIVPPISLASSLWKLLKARFMVQGSSSSRLVSWQVGEGPRDEARWIQVFCCLKQRIYLVGRFCIHAFALNLLTPCIHSVFGIYVKYARGHPKNRTVLWSHFPEILTHAHTVCTRGPGDKATVSVHSIIM